MEQENNYCIKIHTTDKEVIDLIVKKEQLKDSLAKLKAGDIIQSGDNAFWIPAEKIRFCIIVTMNISPDPVEAQQEQPHCETSECHSETIIVENSPQ